MLTSLLYSVLKKMGFTHPKNKSPDRSDIMAWVARIPKIIPHIGKL